MTNDHPRTDGLPEGHPEHLDETTPLVSMTVSASLPADGGDPILSAQMLIHPAYSSSARAAGMNGEEIGDAAQRLIEQFGSAKTRLMVPVRHCARCGGLHLRDDEPDAGATGAECGSGS